MQQLQGLALHNAPTITPMDTANSDVSAMFTSFSGEGGALPAPNDFALKVNQVMQGLEPAARSAADSPTDPAGPSSHTAPAPVAAHILDAAALASGPASRRRGLAYARHVKAVAREEFKENRRRELEASGEGDRTKRRKKNDTSMTERQKYRRRLQKNQDSAAAARHAQDAYIANLEEQADKYDADMTRMTNAVRRAEAEREEYARLNAVFMDHTRNLEAELQHLREVLASRSKVNTKQSPGSSAMQLDGLNAVWSGNGAGSNAVARIANTARPQPQVPPTPPSFKALFEEYSAPTYSFPTDDERGTKLPAAF